MKIVGLKTFRELPANTLFSKYKPCCFEHLCIKMDTWENDFMVQHLVDSIECCGSDEFAEILLRAPETGESIEMYFETQMRDGCFEDDQLFAIWETNDVRDLIARLEKCMPVE